ncbi:hypothetical protein FQZ97_1051240 [compost metagenome]
MEPLGGSLRIRLGVKGDQRHFRAARTFFNAPGHGTPYLNIMRVFPGITVAAQYPDDILAVFVAVSYPSAILICVFRMEDLRSLTPGAFKKLVTPGGQQRQGKPQFVGLVNDEVYMFKIGFIGPHGILID